MRNTELYKEPLEITDKLSITGKTEMSEWQSGFLCGLIKQYQPKKIVEVGVAAGGTTAIMLNCIAMLGLDSEIYSVDLNETHYRDKTKKTGYLAEECKPFLKRNVIHKTYYGGVLPKFLDEIGDDIDFLVLDTVHSMPGEILDFLASLPRLKDGAVVVLHDIILNHLLPGRAWSFATKVLLSTAVGDKILGMEAGNPCKYPGIGAFQVTQDTRKYIGNVFLSLTISWAYMPEAEELEIYRKYFRQYYCDELCEEFDAAIGLNRGSFEKREVNLRQGLYSLLTLTEELKGKEPIYVYGCGYYGKRIYDILQHWNGIKVEGYVISDDQEKSHVEESVEYISDIDNETCIFVIGMGLDKQDDVRKNSLKGNCIYLDKDVINLLRHIGLPE